MHQLHGFVLFSLKQMGGIQLKKWWHSECFAVGGSMIFRFQGFSEGYKMPQKAAGNRKGKNCSTECEWSWVLTDTHFLVLDKIYKLWLWEIFDWRLWTTVCNICWKKIHRLHIYRQLSSLLCFFNLPKQRGHLFVMVCDSQAESQSEKHHFKKIKVMVHANRFMPHLLYSIHAWLSVTHPFSPCWEPAGVDVCVKKCSRRKQCRGLQPCLIQISIYTQYILHVTAGSLRLIHKVSCWRRIQRKEFRDVCWSVQQWRTACFLLHSSIYTVYRKKYELCNI